MGIIGDIVRGAKTVANTVKGIFTQKPTTVAPERTLNEEINNNVQQTPTIQVGSFPNTLNNQINADVIQTPVIQNQVNQNTATLSAPTIETQRRANVWARNNIAGFNTQNDLLSENWESVNEQIQEEADADKGFTMPDFIGFGEKLIGKGVDLYTRYSAKKRYDNEVEANSKSVLLAYNPTTQIATKLTPKDEEAFAARLQQFNSEYENATTYEEQQAALRSFYEDEYKNFKAQARQLTAGYDGLKKYSSDSLSSVSNNKVKAGEYQVSEDEFFAYLETIGENDEVRRNTYKKYEKDLSTGLDEIDLDESETSNEITERFKDIAKRDTLGLINNKLASEVRGAGIRNIDNIISDQVDRLLPTEMYLKKLRDEAAQTPASQRTQWQNDMIYNYDVTWRGLMDKYANNINDYLILQLNEGVDDNGQIADALWKFEDGRELNDILRNGLDEMAGIDIGGTEVFGKVSAIDILRRFANETAYQYRQGKLNSSQTDNPREVALNNVKSGWNEFEHWGEGVGERRGEAGQSIWRLGTKLTNTVASAFDGRRGRNSPAAAYWDADFSIGKLIETDDSPSRRTVKKYVLQFGEYVPEGLGTLAPDLMMAFATSGGSAPSMLRSFGTLSKNIKRFSKVRSFLEKSNAAAKLVNSSLRGLERVGEIGRNLGNINSVERRVFNIADRALSQFAIGQSMDAKLSAFDTEPYSDTSFWLSIGGSLLGDILPEVKDIWGIMRTGAKGGKAWTKGTGVWDLVDFINQSDENALLIAKQMGKDTSRGLAEFSEEDLKNYVRTYAAITDAAKRTYDELTAEGKAVANSRTKELMYNYVKQAYGANSYIGKAVRVMLENQATNPADIIKYLGKIPGTVSVGPYQSVIKLKHGTLAGVEAKNGGWYDAALDVVDGGFGNKVTNGFTFKDIQDISKVGSYSDVLQNRDKYFRKVVEKIKQGNKTTTRTRWVLTEDGLDKFGLEAKSLSLDSLGIEISDAENVREIFKEKMKELDGITLSSETIDALADGGGYNEVVNKIENILC